ncbi:OstA-like protein [Rhodohalobacter sp. SW132]|uniref:OstA-like protein n=1 Tax=Rhodohalobacter sp. SW132 TaxID=2293433 RepID=UPI00131499E0|nr:OstA-like protein [Rhodohalobacter sp. SW132]
MLIKPKKLLLRTGLTALLCFSFTGFIQQVSAQSQVFIENANRAEGTIVDGENVRKLIGNVILRTEDMRMEADSAYQFINRNLIHAFNIQIETDEDIIWADTLYHDTFTDFSQFRGRVIIESPANTVFSEAINLISPLDLAVFLSPVRFEDERGVLLAESGLYFQRPDSAIFHGDVQLADTTQYLEADSLFMNRSKDLYELHGRVFADDYEEKVTFEGNYLFADSLGYRLLTGDDAWMMEISESETDTTHLIAKKIELTETDTLSMMDAYQQVRIWSTKFSAIADTANYRDEEEMFILRGNPILWQKNIQLTGPYIEATLENEDIRFLKSFPRPIVVQEDSATGRLNQMTGDTLHAYFDEGELERLIVFDNSEIIFHQKDEDDEPDGLMELIAVGSSTMIFLNGEFDNFKAERNIDGSYIPEGPQVSERRLENFQWSPERKPDRPAIRIPRLNAILDIRPFELPPRYVRYLEDQEEIVEE